jgi:hypothetical protein
MTGMSRKYAKTIVFWLQHRVILKVDTNTKTLKMEVAFSSVTLPTTSKSTRIHTQKITDLTLTAMKTEKSMFGGGGG